MPDHPPDTTLVILENDTAEAGLAEQLPANWTPIAFRPRHARLLEPLVWTAIFAAPIDIDAAHSLRKSGAIIMASRHTDNRVELVVRRATSRSHDGPATPAGDESPSKGDAALL